MHALKQSSPTPIRKAEKYIYPHYQLVIKV